MLVIMRRADGAGGVGSAFTVGDMTVALLWVGVFSVKFRVRFAGGAEVVSTVPLNGALRLGGEVLIRPMPVRQGKFRNRSVRVGIEAPKTVAIERDDMIHRRAA